MEFQTKRLLLRPWRTEDAEILYEYASDPEIGPLCGWKPHASVEESRKVIEIVLKKPMTWAVCVDGRPVGVVEAKRDDEGVFLEDSKGNVIARGKIIKSTLTTLDAKFEDEIDDGVYYFVVRTRSGDKDRQLTYKTRHKVTVQKKL